MIAGLPGVANEFIDRILFRYFLPENMAWQDQLGVFQAGVKIAVLISLFIQMFRYAAEPHVFAGEKNKQAPMHLAVVMNHFTAFCMVIFLFVMFYIDAIGLLLGKNFRTGLDIVPIMLGAYVLLGMSFNISMWYKLSGKTQYAVYITTAGLLVTLVINILFMPVYGYHAAAWGHFFSYLAMVALSAWLGAKHYPVPYNWLKLWAYISVALALFFLSAWLDIPQLWAKWLVNTALLLIYIAFWFRCEKIKISIHDTSKNR
jgi:O-antigen/teichoic acid export membrane protein